MTSIYRDYWEVLAEEEGDDSIRRPPKPPPSRLASPFGQLPPPLESNAETESWARADLYKPHPAVVTYACQRGVELRGIDSQKHNQLLTHLDAVRTQLEPLGMTLPLSFEQLLCDRTKLNAFRVPCHWIELSELVSPCPVNPNRQLVLFLHESQGCNYTYLSFDPSGQHEVVRTTYPYCLDPDKYLDQLHSDPNVYAFCDSFDEFLCWSFDEAIEAERRGLTRWLEWGDSYRSSGDRSLALLAYRVAKTFDSLSQEVDQRIQGLASDEHRA